MRTLAPLADVDTTVYTSRMTERAKLFRNGGSQAVRLPKDCRFPDDQREVVVRKEGQRVVLEPVDTWPPSFLACIGGWQGEIPRPKDDSVRTIKDPFA
jgi:antitoxin VapB